MAKTNVPCLEGGGEGEGGEGVLENEQGQTKGRWGEGVKTRES